MLMSAECENFTLVLDLKTISVWKDRGNIEVTPLPQ